MKETDVEEVMTWSSKDLHSMLRLLIGGIYGDKPEERIDEIRADKKREALDLISFIGIKPTDKVVDLGSGTGMIARVMSQHVKSLKCCDISADFLNFAKQECANIENIEFTLLESKLPDLTFLKTEDIDVIYAAAVFIHFNVFDLYWYFKQVGENLKKGGKFCFTWLNCDDINFESNGLFLEMFYQYKENPIKIFNLVSWNSKSYIERLVKHFGFKIVNSYLENYVLEKL